MFNNTLWSVQVSPGIQTFPDPLTFGIISRSAPLCREVWNHLAFRPGCPFLTTFSVTFNPAYSVGGDAFQKWDESPIFLVNARRKPYYAYEALESGPLQTYFVYFSYSLKLGHLFALL